jgi:type IV secretory pathway VirB10-like protein
MNHRVALCFVFAILAASPAAAQSCVDDIAGLTVDSDGNYVMQKPGGAQASHAQMSVGGGVATPAPNMSRPAPGVLAAPVVETKPADAQSAPKAGAKPSAALETPIRLAQADTDSASSQSQSSDGSTHKKHKAEKKVSNAHPQSESGARIYKENGKTCSGLDQYKVCW